jgi:hypothetical protein
MSILRDYITTRNRGRIALKLPPLQLPRDAGIVRDLIECDLDPVNLHCDGEISRSEALVKADKLNASLRELDSI